MIRSLVKYGVVFAAGWLVGNYHGVMAMLTMPMNEYLTHRQDLRHRQRTQSTAPYPEDLDDDGFDPGDYYDA